MDPLTGDGNFILHGDSTLSKLSFGLIIVSGLISFLAYLPLYQPFLVLSLWNFVLPFPKPWLLLTSPFVCDEILPFVLSAFLLSQFSRFIEPVWGSKEFLRFYLIVGVLSSAFLLIYAGMIFLIIDDQALLKRKIDGQQAVLASFSMPIAQLLGHIDIPIMGHSFNLKLVPFISLVVSVLFMPFTGPDTLLGSIAGMVISYLYLRFMQPHQRGRGDRDFSVVTLIPPCHCCSAQENVDMERETNQTPPQNFGERAHTLGT